MMATRIIVISNDMVMSPGVAKQIPLQSQIAKSKDDGWLLASHHRRLHFSAVLSRTVRDLVAVGAGPGT